MCFIFKPFIVVFLKLSTDCFFFFFTLADTLNTQARGSRGVISTSRGGRFSSPSDTRRNNDEILCLCNELAVKLTVTKESANKGRKFYVCAKPRDTPGRCNFFLWDDVGPQGSNTNGKFFFKTKILIYIDNDRFEC